MYIIKNLAIQTKFILIEYLVIHIYFDKLHPETKVLENTKFGTFGISFGLTFITAYMKYRDFKNKMEMIVKSSGDMILVYNEAHLHNEVERTVLV